MVFRGLGCGFFPVWVFCVPIGLSETAKRLGDRSVWGGRLIPGLYEVIQYTLSLSLIIIAPGRGWAVMREEAPSRGFSRSGLCFFPF